MDQIYNGMVIENHFTIAFPLSQPRHCARHGALLDNLSKVKRQKAAGARVIEGAWLGGCLRYREIFREKRIF